MLLFFGIVLLVIAAVVSLLCKLSNGTSNRRDMRAPQWPAAILALLGIGCFVLRHWLAGHALHW